MSRVMLILTGRETRERAKRWIDQAPMNARVEIKEGKRSLDQNAKFWAALTDIARQKDWHGVKLAPDDWRLVFLDALKQEVRIVPNLTGSGFVNLGRSSSDLSKQEMSDLLEIIMAWGAQNGIEFTDPDSQGGRDGAEGGESPNSAPVAG